MNFEAFSFSISPFTGLSHITTYIMHEWGKFPKPIWTHHKKLNNSPLPYVCVISAMEILEAPLPAKLWPLSHVWARNIPPTTLNVSYRKHYIDKRTSPVHLWVLSALKADILARLKLQDKACLFFSIALFLFSLSACYIIPPLCHAIWSGLFTSQPWVK